jgi:hypothetical protein
MFRESTFFFLTDETFYQYVHDSDFFDSDILDVVLDFDIHDFDWFEVKNFDDNDDRWNE